MTLCCTKMEQLYHFQEDSLGITESGPKPDVSLACHRKRQPLQGPPSHILLGARNGMARTGPSNWWFCFGGRRFSPNTPGCFPAEHHRMGFNVAKDPCVWGALLFFLFFTGSKMKPTGVSSKIPPSRDLQRFPRLHAIKAYPPTNMETALADGSEKSRLLVHRVLVVKSPETAKCGCDWEPSCP